MAATEGNKLRVANGKIVLHRDGKRIVVNANQSFKFTSDELEGLKKTNPDAVRTPVNEEESAVEVKVPTAKKGSAKPDRNQPDTAASESSKSESTDL